MFPLRSSLFPHVPPYLHHLPAGGGYDPPLPQELGQAAWAAPSGISPIVEESVKGGGFTLIQVGLVLSPVYTPRHHMCYRDRQLRRTHPV